MLKPTKAPSRLHFRWNFFLGAQARTSYNLFVRFQLNLTPSGEPVQLNRVPSTLTRKFRNRSPRPPTSKSGLASRRADFLLRSDCNQLLRPYFIPPGSAASTGHPVISHRSKRAVPTLHRSPLLISIPPPPPVFLQLGGKLGRGVVRFC